ncbi:hypothetical protein [Streptomyces californicus]|uniref:hypothetical protein n=1 Tax=Streptomyces californicus TaxID=67351 RepID=UPI003691C22F
MPYVLCELGEHDQATEHACHLWTAETDPPLSLWFRWVDSEGTRVHHRLVLLAMCPAVFHHFVEGYRKWCAYYDEHPGDHSFHVRDPLRDEYHAQIRREAQRPPSDDDPAEP